ncbi:MAG: hypothetical protein A3G81_12530 [Betaproteobacteria bacterium RIFCSPLOWO2_12_FULL_65_14]|nr:MAG: hypothetical protein A3G81_12530 [Betaproteobacteria bacterium RIFCSPLOWO2_12_FULL_65_14]
MTRTIMVDATEQVVCPKCSHAFALSEGISRQTIERYAGEFEQALAARRKQLEAELAAEAKRRAEREAAQQLDALKGELAAAQAAAKASKDQLQKAREEASAAAKEQYETDLRAAREALAAKDSTLAGLRNAELAVRRELLELRERAQSQELEFQRKLDEERKRIEASARSAIGEEFSQKEARLRAQIESAQREAADLKRKLEQGSQQTQGEALELGLEAMLHGAFPMDEIQPVPKGVNGADLLQRVRSPSGQLCGTIVWEAKQTKNWQAAWVQKLKDDQQTVGAEIAVLVTSAMPKDQSGRSGEPFVRESDVWVTRFDAARPLAEALRVTLLEMHKLRQANLGRSEKMELLYNYICSPQFAQRVKSVVEGFEAMRRDLEAEKASMTRIWKKREMQLTRMTTGMLGVVGDLQGIGREGMAQLDSIAALPDVGQEEATEFESDAGK